MKHWTVSVPTHTASYPTSNMSVSKILECSTTVTAFSTSKLRSRWHYFTVRPHWSEVKSSSAPSLFVLKKPRTIYPHILWWPCGHKADLCSLSTDQRPEWKWQLNLWPRGPRSFWSQTLSSWATCRWSFLKEDISLWLHKVLKLSHHIKCALVS